MRLSTKKTIAREFLFLIGSFIIAALIWLIIYFRNESIQTDINRNNDKINLMSHKIDSLEYALKDKRIAAIATAVKNKYPEYLDVDNTTLYNQVMARYKDGYVSTNRIDEHGIVVREKMGLPNIVDSSISPLKEQKQQLYIKVAKSENKKIFPMSGEMLFLRIVIILLIISFGARYFFIGVKWSIKTLKQKS